MHSIWMLANNLWNIHAYTPTNIQVASIFVIFFQLEQIRCLVIALLSFVRCILMKKNPGVNLAEPISIDCGPNYAGFLIKCILQEAGSVERREQSLEMCDLYSAAPNTFVLLRSCISFAPLSLSFLFSFPSDAFSLPAATCLVILHLAQPTTFTAALPVSLLPLAFFQVCLSSPSNPLFFLLLHSPASSACVGVTELFSQIALKPFYFIFSFLRILLFSWKECLLFDGAGRYDLKFVSWSLVTVEYIFWGIYISISNFCCFKYLANI